ncbi:MAG: alpha-N-arabinofuranosidase [Lentisphaeria bacterium]|nr:alpha-N-arabinofuranosidase [Lentisphaeria bacterium]
MSFCRVDVLPEKIGKAGKELYGGFVEHLGRNVYGGVFDPQDPCADENGFRKDTLSLIRELDMPVTRYPGGNFAHSWKWEESIGPKEKRPVRLDDSWKQKEPYLFGLDEFVRWCRLAGTEPLLTFNLCTRGILEARELWEYCNFPKGTFLSDLRRANGAEEPYHIKYFCLGNEMNGSCEVGQRDAKEYAWIARETAKTLKRFDPEIKLIFCGAEEEWNRIVAEECFEFMDFLSLHEVFNWKDGRKAYLESVDRFGERIDKAYALCEEIAEKRSSDKRIRISVDEWIVWDFDQRGRKEEEWTSGRHLLEQDYNILDAVLQGALFSMFQNRCDKVGLACCAQSVNVLAPIRTEKNSVIWKQATFDPFKYNSRYGRGDVWKTEMETNGLETAPAVSVVSDREKGTLTFFISVRTEQELEMEFCWKNFENVCFAEALTEKCDSLTQVNAPGRETLRAEKLETVSPKENGFRALFPGYSWNMVRFDFKEDSR